MDENRKKGEGKRSATTGKVSHEENSRTGIALAQQMWPVDESVQWKESKFQ